MSPVIRGLRLALVFGVLTSAPLSAETPQAVATTASRAYPPHVVREFERAMRQAEKGDPLGQLHVGSAYYSGAGVPVDYRLAAEWFAKAARQGDRDAQRNLKIMAMSYRGDVNPTTLVEMAKTWPPVAPPPRAAAPRQPTPEQIFKDNLRGARKGEVMSQNAVAAAYYLGQGTAQDRAAAAGWYAKAAAQGDRDAQAVLAMMYATGEGVVLSPVEAVRLYTQAAEQGHERAQFALATMLHEGRGVPRDDAAAARWFRRLAEQGFANAQLRLAGMYASGVGLPLTPVDAYFWADVASDRLPAASTLTTASSVPSREQAMALRETTAAKLTVAQLADARAHAALWKAAARYDKTAQLALAERYLNGSGRPRNLPEAYRWLTLAMGSPIIAREDLPTTKPYNDRRDALLARRDALEGQMTQAQRVEAKRLTVKGLPNGRMTER